MQLVEAHGVAFELDDRTLKRFTQEGASAAVLSSVKKMAGRYVEEQQRMRQQQEEIAKRSREEEAKRRGQAKSRAEEEQRRLAELERKKQEENKRRADEARRRQQEEERRKEDERMRAEEQKRQQDEADKARLAEEQRRQEEARLAEEKRRAQEEARRAEAEKKKQQEVNKIEEEKRRADARSWMLDQMKKDYIAAPSYKDGDMWHFNVIENTNIYSSRALKGLYEIRYFRKNFLVFKEGQHVTSNDSQIGVLLALVGRGRYMGGQYLKFPLSIGRKWNHQYESGVRASRVIASWNAETTVKNVENIATPAGKFWTFKIVRDAWTHRGSKATFTYNYSPQIKTIVKILWEFSDSSRTIELIEFGFGQ
jgi:hypothetical protein